MERNYEVVKSEELSTQYDERYVVISKETGETLDDAQGYGYKSVRKAYAAYGSIQMEYTKEDGSYLEFEINLNDTWDTFEVNENGEESAFSVAADAEVVNKVAKDFMQSPKENTISLIEPTLLVQYLMSKGWKIFPRKRQDIKVLQIKKADGSFFQVTIPLSRALSDYGEALSIALETVAEAENMDKKQLIEKLISPTVNNSAIE